MEFNNGDFIVFHPEGKGRGNSSLYVGPVPRSPGWHLAIDRAVRKGKGGSPVIHKVHESWILTPPKEKEVWV